MIPHVNPMFGVPYNPVEYPTYSGTRWRLRATDTNGSNDAFGVRELQMFESADATGTNLAVVGGGVTTTGSLNDGGYPQTNAFNGNTGDFWTSLGTAPPAGGHWIGIIFPTAKTIKSFRVYTRGEWSESPVTYAIDYWDGAAWQTVKTGGAIPGDTWTILNGW